MRLESSSPDGLRQTFALTGGATAGSLVGALAGVASLRDLSVIEPDIEDVIARLYVTPHSVPAPSRRRARSSRQLHDRRRRLAARGHGVWLHSSDGAAADSGVAWSIGGGSATIMAAQGLSGRVGGWDDAQFFLVAL